VGQFLAIAAVPHSSDAWAIGENNGGLDNATFFVARRHNGRWTRAKTPSLGGRYGYLDAITSVSAKGVWLAGGRQQSGGSIQDFPAIWRWSGKKFVAQKLAGLGACACGVGSISASSSSNVWAVGAIYGAAGQAALHWNGKRWSDVAFPEGLDFEGLTSVSTSGPDNAWATRSDGYFVHWDGKTWTINGTAPAGAYMSDIATTTPKLAYAVGGIRNAANNTYQTVVMRFNGTSWSNAPLAKGIRAELSSVTMHGSSAWAVGTRSSETTATPTIVHTTGGKWTTQKSSGGNRFRLSSVSAESAKRVYAVGYYVQGSAVRVVRTFFDVLIGHSWKPVSSRF
jgi:hypothetical protein